VFFKGKIRPSDANLFFSDPNLVDSFSKKFTPSFLDQMVSSGKITQVEFNKFMSDCNQVYSCASDTLLSGNPAFGQLTAQTQVAIQTANAIQRIKSII